MSTPGTGSVAGADSAATHAADVPGHAAGAALGRLALAAFEPWGDADAGVCVDGVCTLPDPGAADR